MDIKEKLRLLNANSFYGSRITPKERDNMIKEVEDILRSEKMTREEILQVRYFGTICNNQQNKEEK